MALAVMSTEPGASSPGGRAARNRGIDLLRGICILLVIFNHVGIRIPLAKSSLAALVPAEFLRDLNYNGYEAVFVFFVISGFLITRRAHEHWGDLRQLSIHDFYLRRAARILPCLFALLAVLALLHLAELPRYTITRPEQSLPRAIVAALGLHLNWYEGVTGYLPGSWDVLWSLSIEEVFYLGFPLLCLLCGGTRWFVAVLAVLALSMPWTHAAAQGNEIWQEKAYLPGMGAIAVGILAALLARHVPPPPRRTARLLRLLGALGLAAIVFAGSGIWQLLRDGYLLVLTLSAASLVLGWHWQVRPGQPYRFGALNWIASCGRLSYEIYLTHMFCVFAVVDIAAASGTEPRLGYLWYPPAVAFSWLLGWIVARCFSEPCERWLRSGRWRQRRATPSIAIAAEEIAR